MCGANVCQRLEAASKKDGINLHPDFLSCSRLSAPSIFDFLTCC